ARTMFKNSVKTMGRRVATPGNLILSILKVPSVVVEGPFSRPPMMVAGSSRFRGADDLIRGAGIAERFERFCHAAAGQIARGFDRIFFGCVDRMGRAVFFRGLELVIENIHRDDGVG